MSPQRIGHVGSTLDFRNTAQYDTLGRVTEIIQQNQSGGNAVTAKRAAFEYNTLNQRTKLTRYQSTGTSNLVGSTEYGYDTLNRLNALTHKQNSTVLAGYTYGYDGVSRLTSVTSTIEGLSSYTYDAASQVTAADHAAGGQADETYGYDLNGNRNTSGYTTTTNNRTTAQPGFTYVYDDQGNRISRTETATGKVTEYSWDHRNRLTVVKDRSSSGGAIVKQVDYAYDAFNRLVKRTLDADGAGAGAATSQYWVYDEGINAFLQFDGSASTNLSHRYLWTGVVDELIADEIVGSGADTLYALSDHLGTIRDIANYNESTSATTVTNHRTYSSFGKLTAETNAAVDLIFGYTGKQLDDATGLQHNLFRWYDSALGQWLSEDPLGFAAGDENLKAYVGNEAIRAIDPLGLFTFPFGWDDPPSDPPEVYFSLAPWTVVLNGGPIPGTLYSGSLEYKKLLGQWTTATVFELNPDGLKMEATAAWEKVIGDWTIGANFGAGTEEGLKAEMEAAYKKAIGPWTVGANFGAGTQEGFRAEMSAAYKKVIGAWTIEANAELGTKGTHLGGNISINAALGNK